MSKKKSFGIIISKALKSLDKKKKLKKAKLKIKIKIKEIERKNIFIEPVDIPKAKGSIFFKK